MPRFIADSLALWLLLGVILVGFSMLELAIGPEQAMDVIDVVRR